MEARERGSPSWFNAQEISVVVEWVNKLMTTRDVSERDIGIISPYAKQVILLFLCLIYFFFGGEENFDCCNC